jgi:hypothetical protein
MDISGILSEIKVGGFVNPIAVGTQLAVGTLPSLTLAEFIIMAGGQLTPIIPLDPLAPPITPDPISPALLGAAYYSINNSMNKIQDLLGHTDRLSGVNLSGNGNVATIAQTMIAAKNITGELSCGTMLGAFGSIIDSTRLVAEVLDIVVVIKEFLTNIPKYINSTPAILDTFSNKIAQQILSDVTALTQAQIIVIQAAVAQNLISLSQDECTSQILAAVMTQPMKTAVTKAIDSAKSKKLISIAGKYK